MDGRPDEKPRQLYERFQNNTIKDYKPSEVASENDAKRPSLAVDVDLTVCQIDNAWWSWLNHIHHTNYAMPEQGDEFSDGVHHFLKYDLGWYFGNSTPYKRYESVDFFRKEGAYDFAKPVKYSVGCLNRLAEHFDIVFVTKIKGNHHKSKYHWLHRNFPFIKTGNHGVIATNEKWWVKADYLIDDRNYYLNSWREKTGSASIVFCTKYEQDQELTFEPSLKSWDWREIEEYLMNEEEID